MNFVERWIIEKGVQNTMSALFDKLSGYKTYILAGLGILVGLVGHFFGPFNIGSLQVPAFSWNDVWNLVWNGGLFAALRAGVAKSGPTA